MSFGKEDKIFYKKFGVHKSQIEENTEAIRKAHRSLQITDNDILNRRGVYYGNFSEKLIINQDLTLPRIFANAYNRNVIIDFLTLTQTGNIHIAGYVYDSDTDTVNPHIEIISVSVAGRIMTEANFIGQITLLAMNGLAGTIDAFIARSMTFLNTDFKMKGIYFSFVPDSAIYGLQISIYKIDKNGNNSIVLSKAFSSTDTYKFGASGKLGSWRNTDEIVFKGSINEGFYIVISKDGDASANPTGTRTVSLYISLEKY